MQINETTFHKIIFTLTNLLKIIKIHMQTVYLPLLIISTSTKRLKFYETVKQSNVQCRYAYTNEYVLQETHLSLFTFIVVFGNS